MDAETFLRQHFVPSSAVIAARRGIERAYGDVREARERVAAMEREATTALQGTLVEDAALKAARAAIAERLKDIQRTPDAEKRIPDRSL